MQCAGNGVMYSAQTGRRMAQIITGKGQVSTCPSTRRHS
jgi:hypothetical protein